MAIPANTLTVLENITFPLSLAGSRVDPDWPTPQRGLDLMKEPR